MMEEFVFLKYSHCADVFNMAGSLHVSPLHGYTLTREQKTHLHICYLLPFPEFLSLEFKFTEVTWNSVEEERNEFCYGIGCTSFQKSEINKKLLSKNF